MDFQSEKSFGKLRLRAFQPYHQILCMSKHVEDVEDGKRTYRHTFIIPFLDFQSYTHINMVSFECNLMYVEACRRCQR